MFNVNCMLLSIVYVFAPQTPIEKSPPLRMTLFSLDKKHFTDASLRIGWKIENTSQKPIALSQMVINKVTFFVRVSDMNDKAVEFPGSERHIDGILRLKELPLVRLEPGEYWGATKQIERYSVRLAKPGKYKIVATISGNTKFPGVVIPNTIAPLWTDDIVSQPIVIQVNKPSK